MNLTLRIWRQSGPDAPGELTTYQVSGISPEMSFLEMLDTLNEELILRGEVPVAFVVLRPDRPATAEELIEHCSGQLARFKVPKDVTFLDALPRNPSGKVLKRDLRR